MHGNVREWCEDDWHKDYNGAPSDGSAWITGGDSRFNVVRGGSWNYNAKHCRSAYRIMCNNISSGTKYFNLRVSADIGFRVAYSVTQLLS